MGDFFSPAMPCLFVFFCLIFMLLHDKACASYPVYLSLFDIWPFSIICEASWRLNALPKDIQEA